MIIKPSLERRDDLRLGQAGIARTANGEDEWKAELRAVVGVELPDLRELLGRARGQAGLLLLVRRFRGERRRHHTCGELGVRANQRQLRVATCIANDRDQRQLKRRQARKASCGTRSCGAFSDPRRVFVDRHRAAARTPAAKRRSVVSVSAPSCAPQPVERVSYRERPLRSLRAHAPAASRARLRCGPSACTRSRSSRHSRYHRETRTGSGS